MAWGFALTVAAAPCLVPALVSHSDSNVAGHVMRMGGSGRIYLLKRDGRRIEITDKKNQRIVLEVGDDLRPEGQAWVIYYSVANREAIRKPPLETSTRVLARADRRKPKSLIFGARPQGAIPAAANRLFARNSERQPLVLIGNEPLRFGAVTVSGEVKPSEVELVVDGETYRLALGGAARLRSNGIVHQLVIPGTEELLTNDARAFVISVGFSDGSRDTARFDIVRNQSGSEELDLLRRALTRYSRAQATDDEWFFRLYDLTQAYESLGCQAQASSTILDWWFQEPDNEAAMFALRAIAMEFGLGALEKGFADKAPE